MKRPLEWLTAMAAWELRTAAHNYPLIMELLRIAAVNGPNDAKTIAKDTIISRGGFGVSEADQISKGVRWAAIIRRDYEQKSFNYFTDLIKTRVKSTR